MSLFAPSSVANQSKLGGAPVLDIQSCYRYCDSLSPCVSQASQAIALQFGIKTNQKGVAIYGVEGGIAAQAALWKQSLWGPIATFVSPIAV